MSQSIKEQEYLVLLQRDNPDMELLERYKGYLVKTKFKCNVCGLEWEGVPRNYANRKPNSISTHHCFRCYRRRQGNNQRDNRETAQSKISKASNNNLLLLKYSGKMNGWGDLRCQDCGYIWRCNQLSSLVYGTINNGCPSCNKKLQHWNAATKIEDVAQYIQDNQLPFTVVGYDRLTRYATLRCNNCASVFKRSYRTNNPRLGVTRCPYCSTDVSQGERSVLRILKYNNYKYQWRYIFHNEIRKNYQHLDFYLPDLNIAFEVQGEQHYVETSGYYKPLLPVLDNDKAEWCNEHNIKLYYLYPAHGAIYPQIKEIISVKKPPEDFLPVQDKKVNDVVQYLKNGHTTYQATKYFGIGEKVVLRYIRLAGYNDVHDLKDQELRKQHGNFTNDDIIGFLRHHHAPAMEEKFGITLRYVQRHIFEKDEYSYTSLTDIKMETIKSPEFAEYRKTHDKRTTERYFMIDSSTLDKIFGGKDW